MPYYIVPQGGALSLDSVLTQAIHTQREARERADALHQSFGNHYSVVRVETVWTTTTLADLRADERVNAMLRRGPQVTTTEA